MHVISVSVGMPREVVWKGATVRTAIFKGSVDGAVTINALNLEGDNQADLSVHGGRDKAVYAYPAEHYKYWRQELPDISFSWGMFGENLTTHGLLEESVHVGDQFSVGSAELVVTQPRMPCYKLGVRFQSDDMVKRFLLSGRTGFYFAVGREGKVGPRDQMKLVRPDENAVPISEITRLYVAKRYCDADIAFVRRALRVSALPENWKAYFRQRVQRANP